MKLHRLLILAIFAATSATFADTPAELIKQSGIKGGFIVHLGTTDGKRTAALLANERYQVQGLTRDAKALAGIRKAIASATDYGPVAADLLSESTLPYVDNLVNLIVADDISGVSEKEIMRVLTPRGVALVRDGKSWRRLEKAWPNNIDEWTHYLHGADGNAVAKDDVVAPPRHLQWIGSPRWSRHHDRMASMSALVSARGRIIYVMDEGSRISIQLPPKWTLIARDAFNGTILWKQPIPKWHSHLWPLKSGPTQLARRLVAVGDEVFATMGITAPLSKLDAATGKVLHTYKGTDGTEEVLVRDGRVYVLVNKGVSELANYVPKHNVGDQRRVRTEFVWNEQARVLMAFDQSNGKKLWQHETTVAPLSMTAGPVGLYFHDGKKMIALDPAKGNETWSTEPIGRRSKIAFNFGLKIVVHEDLVLAAGGDRKMTCYEAASGKQLWQSEHARGGYESPEDLLVAGGLVWSAPLYSGRDSGVWTGRDVRSGEVKKQFPPNVDTYWFHHRCYISKATENFLLPSRTGIEFVDYKKGNWTINHWVRGGCLYGIMPSNGLVYSAPHNCACYPEAKLYGLNALAPAASRKLPAERPPEERLTKGPAYGKTKKKESTEASGKDWPTYRGTAAREGYSSGQINPNLQKAWEMDFNGRLSAVTVAGGKLFVAEIDAHTVHALDASTGKNAWSFTTGARVDSPPTIHEGAVLFGSCDGHVYCLRASDGELAWKFQAAPSDLRTMAFEQLESIWPVHGSILVQKGVAYTVAGRSNFLDTGLRFYKLDPHTGKVLGSKVIDSTDPTNGKDMQDRLQTLQMGVGLSDILSSDGNSVYMRSQRFDLEGNRIGLGPHSGNAADQGSVQSGEGRHLFSPTGFLDGDWFHRSYWVYGKSFAGGHNGYYQAGKFTPAGRILACDGENVYGFGRKPQYYKWTTTIEHQLFSADKNFSSGRAEGSLPSKDARRGDKPGVGSQVAFPLVKTLDPTGKPLAVEAWVKAENPSGVILARGGPANGFALIVHRGKPWFMVRSDDKLYSVTTRTAIISKWTHLAGILTPEKELQLYVNGELASTKEEVPFVAKNPIQPMEIGVDGISPVGEYTSPFPFTGIIDEVRLHYGPYTAEQVRASMQEPGEVLKSDALVLSCNFNKGKAADMSGLKHTGKATNVKAVDGKFQQALRFTGKGPTNGGKGSKGGVEHNWDQDISVLARSMVLAKDTIFLAGPPDNTDEEDTFKRIMERDKSVEAELAAQDAALQGKQGGVLLAIDKKTGKQLSRVTLEELPTWDGMAAANGKIFITTEKGKVICLD
jgi:outer membrane protein assembly factor BamB